MVEREISLRRVNKEFNKHNYLADGLVFAYRARQDFDQAFQLAETLDPEQKVEFLVQTGIGLSQVGMDSTPVIIQLESFERGTGENVYLKRKAIYGLGKIYLAMGEPEMAFAEIGQDPYPGGPYEPEASLDIAKSLYSLGRNPNDAIIRATQLAGNDTAYAPQTAREDLEAQKKIADDILIAQVMFEVGLDSKPILDAIKTVILNNPELVFLYSGRGFGGLSDAHKELARAYAISRDLEAVLQLADAGIRASVDAEIERKKEAYRANKRSDVPEELNQFRRELGMGQVTQEEFLKRRAAQLQREIEVIKQKDRSSAKADFLTDIALDLLNSGRIQDALEIALKTENGLSIGEVAARGAVILADRGGDAKDLVELGLKYLLNVEIPEKTGRYYRPKAKQAEMLSFVARASDDQEPIFNQAVALASSLEPARQHYSYRSSVWSMIGKNLQASGFDASFAFEKAVELLHLQNGPLIAASKLGEWPEGPGRGWGDSVGNWQVFKREIVEMAYDQLESGYFELAEKTVQGFVDLDTQRRFYKPEDRARFLATKALELAKRGLKQTEIKNLTPSDIQIVASSSNPKAKDALTFLESPLI